MITVTECDKPILNYSSVSCDSGIHPKLDKYELLSNFNRHSFNMIIGRPGSGKSSLLQSLFNNKHCFKKCFNSIYLFQPATSRGSMKNDIFNNLPSEMVYNELTENNLQQVINNIKQASDENHCIILDDMGAYLKNVEIQKLLKELVFNRRHLHTSIFVVAQSYKSLPLDLRKLVSNFIIFKVSKLELNEIFKENVESLNDYTDQISKIVYDAPHNFLAINPETRQLFKNWDKLCITLPGEEDED